jgi:PAS domain S-box-containing protein
MKPTPLIERLLVDQPGLRPGSWGAYLATVAMVAVATAVRLLLEPVLAGVQFITFFAAVMLAAFLCGGAAGMLAVVLSALSAWAFIMAPAFAFEHAYAVGLFLVLGSLDVVIISALRASIVRVRHLNASLRDSEMRYRTVADNASDLITLQGIDRQFQFISPACRRLGYEPEEMRGLAPESLVHPDDLEMVFRTNGSLSAETPTAKSVLRVRHKDGSYVWAEAIYNWVAARTDREPQILTVAREITERKLAEDAAARLQALLNEAVSAIDDGIAIYDSEKRLIVANSAMSRLSGGPADLLTPGRTFTELIDRVRTGYRDIDDEAFAAFRSRRTAQFRTADGVPDEYLQPSGAWIEIRDFRTREGGAVSVVSDITALKTTAIELDRARARAEAANVAKSRFLAAASHDLRQPLQTIALLEGILKQKVTDPEAASIIDQLGISLNAMAGMLDTLLEVNQLEAGIVNPAIEDFAIDNLLERLRAELGYHAEAKGLALQVVRSSAIVRSDPKLLEHIVRNLLSNAIKYTNQGKILLGCRRLGSLLRIDVIDTGIGIPQDQMEAVFGEFHQIDNPARDRRRGLGLGLSIVQRLSHLLAHPVKVRSVLGKGSRFSVEVPQGERSGARKIRRTPARSARPTRILLVEDDGAILTTLRMLLERDGHTVVASEDAAHALADLRRTNWRPEVVVSDFNLPGNVNGLELIKLIRKELRERLPAILLTGGILPETQKTLDASDCLILHKPVPSAALFAAIAQCRVTPMKTLAER